MITTDSTQCHPRIRSYICRQGRATAAQRNALHQLWNHYCLDPKITNDYAQIFGRQAPIIVEIGFGNGSSLAEMAEKNPALNYIGIEVHKPGIAQLMILLKQKALNNVRIYHHDAVEILEQKIPDNMLSGVHLFFPDPWQKRKHHKRRLVQPDFVEMLNMKLKLGGYFYVATDWKDYAKEMLVTLTASTRLANVSGDKQYSPRLQDRPLTKFESRGLRLGYGVWDLVFKKIA